MELGIRGAFGFANYGSGGRRGSDIDSHFGCIINLLLINFRIYYHLIMLLTLILIITNRHILDNKVLIMIKLKITHNQLTIQPKCAFLSAISDFWILIKVGRGSKFVIIDFVNSQIPNLPKSNYFWHFEPSYSVWRSVLTQGLYIDTIYRYYPTVLKNCNKFSLTNSIIDLAIKNFLSVFLSQLQNDINPCLYQFRAI